MRDSENLMKQRLDDQIKKTAEREGKIWEKDEQIFEINRNSENLKQDLQNLNGVIDNLKKEIEFVTMRRHELEEVNSELKN